MTANDILNAYKDAGASVTPNLTAFAAVLAKEFEASGMPVARQQQIVTGLVLNTSQRFTPFAAPSATPQLSRFGTETVVLLDQIAQPMTPNN